MNYSLFRQYYILAVCLIWVVSAGALLTRSTQASDIATRATQTVFLPVMMGGPESAGPPPGGEVHTGEATYYAATGGGSCSFDPTPDNLMVAALNPTDYDNARLCGAYVEVTGPQGVVAVRIVDLCPGCATGDIDLSQEAFTVIAELSAGRVPVSWRIISPGLQGPIVYHFKDGSNPYWTAVQIRNHRNPVASFEYLAADGQFRSVQRENYNYFVEPAGMGDGPYTFRVTDIYGHTLTDSGIELVESSDQPGSAQFPAP